MTWGNSNTERPSLLNEINNLSDELERLVLAGEIKLPVLPIVATQVINMAANPNTDLDELSALVHQDQSLAGHVLRISNSALFSGAVRVKSLKEAISRLGFSAIREMAAVITIKGQVFRGGHFIKEIESIWMHALISGYYAKEVANLIQYPSGIPFICGLLHTVGKPILFQTLTDMENDGRYSGGHQMAIINLVERLHSFVGKEAAIKWKLPSEVAASCEFFKDRWDAGEHRQSVAITVLASSISNWCIEGGNNLKENILHSSCVEELELDPEHVKHLFEQKSTILDSVKVFR